MSESQVYSNFFESLQSIGTGILKFTEKVDDFSKKVDSFFKERKESIKHISKFCVLIYENIDKIDNFLNDTHRLKRIRSDLFELPLEETIEILKYHHSIGTFTITMEGYIDFPSSSSETPTEQNNTGKTKNKSKKVFLWILTETGRQVLAESVKNGLPHLVRLFRDFFT